MRASLVLVSMLSACGPGVSVQPVPPPSPEVDPPSFRVVSADFDRGRIVIESELPMTVGVYVMAPTGVRFLGLTDDPLPTGLSQGLWKGAWARSTKGARAGSQTAVYDGRNGSTGFQVGGVNRVCTRVGGDPDASTASGRTLCSYSLGVPGSLTSNPARAPRPKGRTLTLLLVAVEGSVSARRFQEAGQGLHVKTETNLIPELGERVAGGPDGWNAAILHARRQNPSR